MQIVRSAVLFLFAATLSAQTFRGSITGVVTDASGASIGGAAVKLDSPTTGLFRAVYSARYSAITTRTPLIGGRTIPCASRLS